MARPWTAPPAAFREGDYLGANPDVAAAVKGGEFDSGWHHFQTHGRLEGRVLRRLDGLSRVDKALDGLDTRGLGLEIGPSHNPIAPKRAGFNVEVLDHLDAPGLRGKYAAHGVNIDNIEAVDFVWSGEPLTRTIGSTSRYDWIIASHVIEHAPDLVTFLRECEALLKPDGKLALVVPDRRYCFDSLNRASTTGELLDAFEAGLSRPSPGRVFDHFANATRLGTSIAWSQDTAGELALMHNLAQAKNEWNRALSTQAYLDVHCWRFTPASFHLVISDLRSLGLIGLAVVSQFPTSGCEFYMTLARVPAEACVPVERLTALKAAREER